jgi:hypothetical protein
MDYKEFIIRLAQYYDEPEEKSHLPNPKLGAIKQFVLFNWQENELDALLEYIKTEYSGRKIPLVYDFREFKQGKFSGGVNMIARTHKCYCGKDAFKCHHTEWLCYDHYQDAWSKDYIYTKPKTRDGINRYLITKGSNSNEWKNATEQEKANALEYYKSNPNCIIVKIKQNKPVENKVQELTEGL